MGVSNELGQRRYVALDAFRGLAAFGVALFPQAPKAENAV